MSSTNLKNGGKICCCIVRERQQENGLDAENKGIQSSELGTEVLTIPVNNYKNKLENGDTVVRDNGTAKKVKREKYEKMLAINKAIGNEKQSENGHQNR